MEPRGVSMFLAPQVTGETRPLACARPLHCTTPRRPPATRRCRDSAAPPMRRARRSRYGRLAPGAHSREALRRVGRFQHRVSHATLAQTQGRAQCFSATRRGTCSCGPARPLRNRCRRAASSARSRRRAGPWARLEHAPHDVAQRLGQLLHLRRKVDRCHDDRRIEASGARRCA